MGAYDAGVVVRLLAPRQLSRRSTRFSRFVPSRTVPNRSWDARARHPGTPHRAARVSSPLGSNPPIAAMSYSDSESDGMFVMLGGDGRVFGCGDGIDLSFRCYRGLVPLPPSRPSDAGDAHEPPAHATIDELVRDCLLVDSPLADGATFWLGADAADAPRCALEELAAAIFQLHTRDCDDFDAETSGAEWWVQSRPGLSCHWDKDEELRVAAGLFVHPQVSTVTYLTAGAAQAPTLVFEGMTVPSLARQGHDNPADLPAAPECTAVCASYPEVGKHVAFDGRLLHGVLREMAEPDGDAVEGAGAGASSRVTFLVNVWLNHRPKGVRPLPEGLISSLRRPTSMPPATARASSSTVAQVEVAGADAEGWAELGGRFFGWSGDDLKLEGRLPLATLREGRDAEGGVVRVILPVSSGVRVVENDHPVEPGDDGAEKEEKDDDDEDDAGGKRRRTS